MLGSGHLQQAIFQSFLSRQAGTVCPKLFRKSRFAWGNSRHFIFLTIRTRNNLVQFGIDFLVKLVSLDYLFPLFDALGGSGGSQGDLFEHGSEKGLQKEGGPLNF